MTTPKPCQRCGQVHERCAAHNRAGGPCNLRPARDQRVCKWHGGRSPAALEQVAQRDAERAARKVLRERWARGEETPIEDPLTELVRLAGEVVAFKDMLREQVEALDGTLTYWQEQQFGDEETDTAWTKAAEDVRAVVAAYERAQDRAAKVLANIVKLDLAGRMLEFNQRKADTLLTVVRGGLAEVDMPLELRQDIQAAIAKHARSVGGPAVVVPSEVV